MFDVPYRLRKHWLIIKCLMDTDEEMKYVIRYDNQNANSITKIIIIAVQQKSLRYAECRHLVTAKHRWRDRE